MKKVSTPSYLGQELREVLTRLVNLPALPSSSPLWQYIKQIETDAQSERREEEWEADLKSVQEQFSCNRGSKGISKLSVHKSLVANGGKGVFAAQPLPCKTLLGRMWGYPIGWHEPSRFAARFDPGDPRTGKLWREFEKCEVLYINEPPPDKEVNCVWGKRDGRICDRVYTMRDIEAGEELFLWYGPLYQYRDYPTNAPADTWYIQETTATPSLPDTEDVALLLVKESSSAAT